MRIRRLVATFGVAALTVAGGAAAVAHDAGGEHVSSGEVGAAEFAAQDTEDGDSESTDGTLELVEETATVEDGDATAFSQWVESTELDGCQRGLTIAKYAQQGPHDFDPFTVEPVPVDELPGNCAESLDGAEDFESDDADEPATTADDEGDAEDFESDDADEPATTADDEGDADDFESDDADDGEPEDAQSERDGFESDDPEDREDPEGTEEDDSEGADDSEDDASDGDDDESDDQGNHGGNGDADRGDE